MKNVIVLVFTFLLIQKVDAQSLRPIGTNLTAVVDYSNEFVFTDMFMQSRPWTSANADGSGPWDTQIQIPTTSNGYPLEIPYNDGTNAPQKVRSLMVWDLGSATPIGMYRLIVQGNGIVTLNFGANGTFQCPVDTLVNVSSGVSLEIIASDVNNPINDIKFILPAYTTTFQNKLFTDELLAFASDFEVLRFMDWVRTNNSTIQTWSQRTKPSNYTQGTNEGVAWEYAIELSNQISKDIWINIPHLADNNYITQLATLLKDSLHASAKIYVEYSNETWNNIFTQNSETAALAQNLGYTGNPWEQTWKYTAKRSADIFEIFDSVFAQAPHQLVKLIPTQSANAWLVNHMVTLFNDPQYNPNGVTADAITIAPYFAGEIANQIGENNEVTTITVEEIVQRMAASLPQNLAEIQAVKAAADENNLRLICYEAGQHLVAHGVHTNNDQLTEKLIAANHHPDLQAVYCTYFNQWFDETNDLMVHFSSHGTYSKWGSWGVKENMNDTLNPKYLALQSCVFDINEQNLGINNQQHAPQVVIYPNPASSTIFTQQLNGSYDIITLDGRTIQSGTILKEQIDISNLTAGLYFLVNKQHKVRFSKE